MNADDASAVGGAGHVDVRTADDEARCVEAWELKDRGYGSLYADLAQARGAARQLHELAGAAQGEPARAEIVALADWLDGAIAAARGDAAQALAALERAHTSFAQLGRAAL